MSFRSLLLLEADCVGNDGVVVVDGDDDGAVVGLECESDVDVAGNASFAGSFPSSRLSAVIKVGSFEDAVSAVDPGTTACGSSCTSCSACTSASASASASSSTCSVPISMLSSRGLFPSTNQRLQNDTIVFV